MPGVGLQVRVVGTGRRFLKRLENARAIVHSSLLHSLRISVGWVTRDAKLGVAVRSGRLRASIRGRVETGGLTAPPFGVVGSNVIYARIHELGGTIRPRTAKMLTIPLRAAQTAAGVTRKPARAWPDTFILKTRGGDAIIAQRLARGKLRYLFVLKRQVRREKNPYLVPALERNRAGIRELFGRDVRAALEAG